MTRRGRIARSVCACTLLLYSAAHADLSFEVVGVDEALRENILNHNDVLRLAQATDFSQAELDDIVAASVERSREALRPYGYYHPAIRGRHYRRDNGEPVIELSVEPGPAIVIDTLDFAVDGPGKSQRELKRWQSGWPLRPGERLDQVTWEQEKQSGLDIAHASGYLGADYTAHELGLDLVRNVADVTLRMNTGERYVMGDITFGENVLRPGIVESIPRFEPGDPYSAQLMDDFRLDLWRSGYFTDVDVVETKVPDAEPPRVNLEVNLETATRDSYQGALGYGTDTGIRLQALWSRHPMSSRGDRIDVAAGWQEVNSEFAVRGTYRRPLVHRPREYWIADAKISFENQDLELARADSNENFVKIANGNVDERHLKGGWLKLFNARAGEKQTAIQPFVQYLNSVRQYSLLSPDDIGGTVLDSPDLERLLRGTDNALSVGVDFDVVAIVGQGFETRGYHDKAWLFAADRNFGSEIDFLQLYVSTRRTWLRGQRWKFLFRGEIGYTDADVDTFAVDVEGTPIELSVTKLPNFYRFKAGGSASVRGYDFEQLSNNNIGSNNIVTASGEFEFRLTDKWSGAIFADVGNAFNDWSDSRLKLGVGAGIRWYSIAGPIRIDVAQARSFDDRPWRIHLTIGTPLL